MPTVMLLPDILRPRQRHRHDEAGVVPEGVAMKVLVLCPFPSSRAKNNGRP